VKASNNFWKAFGYAAQGLVQVFLSQRNFRVHTAIALAAVVLGWIVKLEALQWIVLILVITLVMSLELVNSAVEAAVDLTTAEVHPLAKAAKDASAAAVLWAAAGALLIGLVMFGPKLSEFGHDFVLRWKRHPLETAGILACAGVGWGLVLALPGWVAKRRRTKPLQ
jgi:diacylglycerol kinase